MGAEPSHDILPCQGSLEKYTDPANPIIDYDDLNTILQVDGESEFVDGRQVLDGRTLGQLIEKSKNPPKDEKEKKWHVDKVDVSDLFDISDKDPQEQKEIKLKIPIASACPQRRRRRAARALWASASSAPRTNPRTC